jgi:soluble lytic murein transglycosylase-like protein
MRLILRLLLRPLFALAMLLPCLGTALCEPEQISASAVGSETSVAATSTDATVSSPSDHDGNATVPAAGSSAKEPEPKEQQTAPSSASSAPSSPEASSAQPDDKNSAPSDDKAKGKDAESLDALCQSLMDSAQKNNLPVPFFANLIWQESRLHNNAVSPVGAQGIAQFMPRVAREFGVNNPFDPRQALPASARMLHDLRDHFGNLGFVAAAYNAGAGRVSAWLQHLRGLPRETRNYVMRITGRSVEQWRKAPPQDDAVTFKRQLPCRTLPAFAEIEETQRQELLLAEQQNPPAQASPSDHREVAAETAKEARRGRFAALGRFVRRHMRGFVQRHIEHLAERHVRRDVAQIAARRRRDNRLAAMHRQHPHPAHRSGRIA